MNNKISQDMRLVATDLILSGPVSGDLDDIVDFEEAIALALMKAKAEGASLARDLADCLADMTDHYVAICGSNTSEDWDAEQEIEVIAARRMIAEVNNVVARTED